MALGITEGASDLTLTGWGESVTISKANLAGSSSTSTVVTVGSRAVVKNGDFLTHVATDGTSVWSGYTSHSVSNGSDYYGDYLDLTITGTQTLSGSTQTAVARLRFYDGQPLMEAVLTTAPSFTGFSKLRFAASQPTTPARWFTTARRMGAYYRDQTPTQANNCGLVDWSSTFPTGDINAVTYWDQPPVGSVPFNSAGGYHGCLLTSLPKFAIAPYLTAHDGIHRIQASYRYGFSSYTMYATVAVPNTGWVLTTVPGYVAIQQYAEWQIRAYPRRTLPAWAYLAPYLSQYSTEIRGDSQPWLEWCCDQVTANELPVGAIENDWGNGDTQGGTASNWYDYSGDFNARAGTTIGGRTLAQRCEDKGFKAGCWVTPAVSADSAVYAAQSSTDAFIKDGGSNRHCIDYFTHDYYRWNPFTANGIAGLKSIAAKVVNMGFEYVRWDICHYDLDVEYESARIFCEEGRRLAALAGQDFVVESNLIYAAPFIDFLRTNDYPGMDASWKSATAFLMRVGFAHCTDMNLLDTDMWGCFNTGDYLTSAETIKQLNLQTGFGRASYAWLPGLDGGSANTDSSAWMPTAWANIKTNILAATGICISVPTRNIVERDSDGDWSGYNAVQTYANGTGTSYTYATDTLTVDSTPDLTATAESDHIALSWTDSTSGEDGWYVERRVV